MSTAFILGTRPEIIKLSPVIRAFLERGLTFSIIHTNQHYSPEMDAVFFEQLGLPRADFNLGVGSGSHGEQIGAMLPALERILAELRPDTAVVQGDTNTVLAGALVAQRAGVRVAHVEAGLRSRDRRMPEELNRILADNLSDILLAPTPGARDILLAEGFADPTIHVTGNTVVDAVLQVARIASGTGTGAEERAGRGGYILVTLHRPENVDNASTFASILDGIHLAADEHGLKAVFPVHPRTASRLTGFGIDLPSVFERLGAVDYLTFLDLLRGARLVITDSGGVQEEACILRVPCVTARTSTERPETVRVGANLVAGVGRRGLAAAARRMLECEADWENPFGDGRAGERIVDILTR